MFYSSPCSRAHQSGWLHCKWHIVSAAFIPHCAVGSCLRNRVHTKVKTHCFWKTPSPDNSGPSPSLHLWKQQCLQNSKMQCACTPLLGRRAGSTWSEGVMAPDMLSGAADTAGRRQRAGHMWAPCDPHVPSSPWNLPDKKFYSTVTCILTPVGGKKQINWSQSNCSTLTFACVLEFARIFDFQIDF